MFGKSSYFVLPGGRASVRIWWDISFWTLRSYSACGKRVYEVGPFTLIVDQRES